MEKKKKSIPKTSKWNYLSSFICSLNGCGFHILKIFFPPVYKEDIGWGHVSVLDSRNDAVCTQILSRHLTKDKFYMGYFPEKISVF